MTRGWTPEIEGPLFGGEPKPTETRADQIFQAFAKFHRKNPQVWRMFCDYASRARRAGRTVYSARTIISVLRFELDLETDTDEPVKINDHFSPYYGRMYLATHPEAGDFFQLRKRISEREGAHAHDEQVFNLGPAGAEDDLLRELISLAEEAR